MIGRWIREIRKRALIRKVLNQYGAADTRIAAIRKLEATADSQLAEVLVQVFREENHGSEDSNRVIEAASCILEKLGPAAVEPLIDSLNKGRKSPAHVLGRIGGPRAETALLECLARQKLIYPNSNASDHAWINHAVQAIRDPEAARIREAEEELRRMRWEAETQQHERLRQRYENCEHDWEYIREPGRCRYRCRHCGKEDLEGWRRGDL
jgi:hypothetical protein